ncbi:phage tail protein [Desulfovibrio oxamicus]|uniref:Phage tail protein n=1 Tax=Nitratidesulfovibrio oxamicus TaxID=32016 RepID=A0ABS0J4J7_9BACT|nr:phage tail protein [Nitratidesulfovibrio oxamicus]MBG3876673.1 phage tail protein [Nitratidesulfovibrio oxamicus]
MQYYHVEQGFLLDGLHQIPDDAIPLTDAEYAYLHAAQASMIIQVGSDGRPVAVAPERALEEVATAKAREIRAGYDTALAGVLAGAEATATGVAVGSALMAVTDPQGLEYLVDMLTARRVELEQALLAAQADADPVAAVLAIVVSYPT